MVLRGGCYMLLSQRRKRRKRRLIPPVAGLRPTLKRRKRRKRRLIPPVAGLRPTLTKLVPSRKCQSPSSRKRHREPPGWPPIARQRLRLLQKLLCFRRVFKKKLTQPPIAPRYDEGAPKSLGGPRIAFDFGPGRAGQALPDPAGCRGYGVPIGARRRRG